MNPYLSAYRRTKERITRLVKAASEDELSIYVPACPAWTAKDLVSHIVGVTADLTRMNLTELGQPQWTQAHLDARADRSLPDLLGEWESETNAVETTLGQAPPAFASPLLGDLVTHEFDLRGALGNTDERDNEDVALVLANFVKWFGKRIKDAGLPTVIVRSEDNEWTAGRDEPQGTFSAPGFDLFRAFGGRRTYDEIATFEWSVEPQPYLGIFSPYGKAARSLNE